jgi:signal transduction histidine kinase/ActR/RegA family two-component response regulator
MAESGGSAAATAQAEARVRLHALLELTSRLSEPLPAEEVARVVVDQAREAVGAFTAIMWRVEDPPTHATLVRAAGEEPSTLTTYARIPLEPWLPMGDAMARREPLFFESRVDFRNRYPAAEKLVTNDERFQDLSYACLPLVVQGRSIGGLSLVFDEKHAFDDDERLFLAVLAHHAAQALDRAALLDREKQARLRVESLQQLTSALSSAATVKDVAMLAARVGAQALGLVGAGLWATDQNDLVLLGDYGMAEESRHVFQRIPRDSTLPAARIARARRALWCESEQDLESEDPSIAAALGRGSDFQAYGALPLIREERVLGVLAFSAGRPRRFSSEERAFMTIVAEHCADAIARARLYEDSHRMERRLQAVLERLPVGILVARPPDGALVFVNEAYARIWRATSLPITSEERCKVMKATYPDGRPIPRSESPVVRALNGEVVEAMEARIERTDGTIGWVHTSSAPVLREDGSVEVAIAAAVDITAEKTARAAADEAGRAKDTFLATLGHELRNPLTPIVTALSLMRMKGGALLERERAVIERQVTQLTRLVDDLLDVSRAARGNLRLERVPIEISSVVADALEVASPLIEERKQTVTVSVSRTGLVVDADRGRLAQVIINLLNNAAKYTPPGGHIDVSARADGDDVRLEVADNGTGITAELLPRIFESFTQGAQGLDRKQGGLGLGLSIARQLVLAHDGTIEARSGGERKGTLMIVRLPRAAVPSAREDDAAGGKRETPPHDARRVLVVDDNIDAAERLAEALVLEGHDVRVAADGPSALELLEDFAPQIAFLDIGLPVMDGYELAGQLRKRSGLEKIPLVAITGYAQEGDRTRALDAGFVTHLAKPLDIGDILACVDRFATAHAEQQL